MTDPKTFLFLQGPPNGYWPHLAEQLELAGHTVRKINLCLADWVFWRRPRADNYRGSLPAWEAWLEAYIVSNGITDIIYYADQHPYHVAARTVADRLGLRCWAIEFGYLRPDWLTLEQTGMGPLSHFPKDRASIEILAADQSEPDMVYRYPHSFGQEAVGEVVFHLLQAYGRPFYPRFRSDKTYWPAIDYLAWLPEFTRQRRQIKFAELIEAQCLQGQTPFWLVALQIHADYQIRSHSPYDHQEDMLADIFASFAQHTRAGDLVIKIHPMDNGLENWPKRVARQAAQFGLQGRVHLIKGGDLGRFIKAARGVIIANSTVGLHSIAAGVPTLALGDALYDIDGLTHQNGIDSFWLKPQKPDVEFAKTYRRALQVIQVKGSFYHRAGRDLAVAQMVQRLTKTDAALKTAFQPDAESIILAAE
ncbi:MAG: capsular biosynthesis protein [Rhodobacteraceae bacterium]|nr:capsular biosynthesis protein [Paracoccaceae bacterium]